MNIIRRDIPESPSRHIATTCSVSLHLFNIHMRQQITDIVRRDLISNIFVKHGLRAG